MRASPETCPLCDKDLKSEERVVIGKKGADGINNASVDRGDGIVVAAGAGVHTTCRVKYVNKVAIERHKKAKLDPTTSVKRISRVSIGHYDSKTDCLYCGNKVVKSTLSTDYDDYSYVKTDSFVDRILSHCTTRNDDWAFTVQGSIEYFGRDLHAADSLYHRSCDTHFELFGIFLCSTE